jgi:hypothetical protein
MIDVVVPTVGRPSLAGLLASLAGHGDVLGRVFLVDDRTVDRAASGPLLSDPAAQVPRDLRDRVRVLRSGGRGPAAARNVGWQAAHTPWVVTLDDDVTLPPDWHRRLAADLATADSDPVCAAVAGRIIVSLPGGRFSADWERATVGRRWTHWTTTDMAFRVAALESVGGFDERFRLSHREDADLALRLVRSGWSLRAGCRAVVHPPGRLASLADERGNAEDSLMRAIHGRGWRHAAGFPPGRFPLHVLAVGAAAGALALVGTSWFLNAGRGVELVAAGAAATASGLVGDFAASRILAGPRNLRGVTAALATSLTIPLTAVAWRLVGIWRYREAAAWPVLASGEMPAGAVETAW